MRARRMPSSTGSILARFNSRREPYVQVLQQQQGVGRHNRGGRTYQGANVTFQTVTESGIEVPKQNDLASTCQLG